MAFDTLANAALAVALFSFATVRVSASAALPGLYSRRSNSSNSICVSIPFCNHFLCFLHMPLCTCPILEGAAIYSHLAPNPPLGGTTLTLLTGRSALVSRMLWGVKYYIQTRLLTPNLLPPTGPNKKRPWCPPALFTHSVRKMSPRRSHY